MSNKRRAHALGMRAPIREATRRAWGRRLRARRDELGITQLALAETVGCTRACVSAWERGVSAPALEARIAIASALGSSPDVLFPERRRARAA